MVWTIQSRSFGTQRVVWGADTSAIRIVKGWTNSILPVGSSLIGVSENSDLAVKKS